MSDIPTVKIAVIGVGSAGLAALKQAVDAFSRPVVRTDGKSADGLGTT
jgi:malic enzyme